MRKCRRCGSRSRASEFGGGSNGNSNAGGSRTSQHLPGCKRRAWRGSLGRRLGRRLGCRLCGGCCGSSGARGCTSRCTCRLLRSSSLPSRLSGGFSDCCRRCNCGRGGRFGRCYLCWSRRQCDVGNDSCWCDCDGRIDQWGIHQWGIASNRSCIKRCIRCGRCGFGRCGDHVDDFHHVACRLSAQVGARLRGLAYQRIIGILTGRNHRNRHIRLQTAGQRFDQTHDTFDLSLSPRGRIPPAGAQDEGARQEEDRQERQPPCEPAGSGRLQVTATVRTDDEVGGGTMATAPATNGLLLGGNLFATIGTDRGMHVDKRAATGTGTYTGGTQAGHCSAAGLNRIDSGGSTAGLAGGLASGLAARLIAGPGTWREICHENAA